MGKSQKKTGKGRLDKYYKLAKEQGYRARSAFKLIQLNKKYSFLESARCCIDLCAAPGGWLQVASKYMPTNSLIVGVDLVPIRAIPRVTTFAADITTSHCRALLRNELKDWKADVVLHDGAPNVGTAWVQDAYAQSELVLMSLKLAVEFLMPGGTFVTKVFRSADYNNLIWVFNQLFGKVEATKPPSSRNVSAEIFVVCREYKSPKTIDPKFLDPRHVFKDLAASIAANAPEKGNSANNAQANVFAPEKKRRQRDGYADNDYTLFHKLPASDFINAPDPISVLGTANQITFDSEEEKSFARLKITTNEVKANCKDLKVLGKGDFKALMKWRLALREELGLESKKKDAQDATEVVEVTEALDEDAEIQKELERVNAEKNARLRRERRKANEIKTKTIQRMQLKMTAPLDIGLEVSDLALGGMDEDMFDERDARNLHGNEDAELSESEDGAESSSEDDDEGDILDSEEEREARVAGLEAELDDLYGQYQEKINARDTKRRVREAREKAGKAERWDGIKAKNSDDEDSDAESANSEGGWQEMQRRKAAVGEEEESSDDDVDDDKEPQGPPAKRVKFQHQPKASNPKADLWFSQDIFKNIEDELSDDEEEVSDNGSEDDELSDDDSPEGIMEIDAEDSESDDFEIVPQEVDNDINLWDADQEDQDEVKQALIQRNGLTTAEAVTIAQQLVNRQTTKTQLINDGFSRYSLNSKEDLPSWFLDDESKNYRSNVPITKEAINALRARQRALDARPIKKVAEAKARKKYKAAQKLEKAMKKAEGVNATADMSEREKASAIEKLMKRGASKKKKDDIKVVVAKGSAKGIKGRPKGVKGRYTMVDARMRKELRSKKRTEKANKKRKRT